ncbi:MAG: MATE family efflux transporter [Clostridia bacterium]|nr:MATE family efflux transporter [Clostridia bacterium]
MRFLAQPKGVRFSNKDMIVFFLPIFFEQLMLAGLSVADTFMVSAKLGTTALAGVALVNRLDTFAKQFVLALAQGGSVVLAQYIGAEDEEHAQKSLKNNIQIVVGLGVVFMLLMVFFKKQFITLFFGGAGQDVLAVTLKYFSITAFSYPFVALYYASSSLFRVMGESKIPFIGSVVMMGLNLGLKYIFIFKLNMGVTGAALSTLLAMGITGTLLLLRLTLKRNKVRLVKPLKPDFDMVMSARILKISVPNGLEQAMFQLGALILAGLVSGLGEDAINADQLARNLTPLVYGISSAFVALMLMVVGQCLGAGDIEEAERYKKHIIKMNHFFVAVMGVVFIIIAKPLISIFKVSPQSEEWTFYIVVLYTIGSALFYPKSFATPSALRAAGDTKFVMVVSAASMFAFRIGCAYICVHLFNMSVVGIWVAMVSDWVIRLIIFEHRFKKGKWKNNQVI